MDWLKGIAPIIFSALTGNIPGAAISAASFIASKFGWGTKTVDEVKAKLENFTPEQQLEFAKLEIEFQQIQTQQQNLDVLDTKNAREREVSMAQAGKRDWTTPILAYLFITIFFYMIWFFCHNQIPEKNETIITMLIGQLSGIAGTVAAYYFGSSKGSADKSKMLDPNNKGR